MAVTDAKPVPQYGKAYQHNFAIRKNDGTLITTWAGKVETLSKDNGNYAACTNGATEIQTSGTGYLLLSAEEMTASVVVVKVTVTNADALDYVVTLYPERIGDIRDASLLLQTNVDAADAGGGTDITLEGGAANDDAYKGQTFTIYHSSGHVTVLNVTDWDGTDKIISLDGTVQNYTTGDLVLITAAGKADVPDIADAVWNEATAGHTTAGSASKALIDALADTNELQTNQSAWATATSVTVSDKTGFSLAADQSGVTIGTTTTVTNAVVTDATSRTESKADVSALATTAALSTHDGKLDTVDGIVDAILADTDELQTDWVNAGRLDNLLDTAAAGGGGGTTIEINSEGETIISEGS